MLTIYKMNAQKRTSELDEYRQTEIKNMNTRLPPQQPYSSYTLLARNKP